MARALRLLVALPLFVLGACATVERGASPESPYVAPESLRAGQILHLATGRLLSDSEATEYLSRFPVVYVGEGHDNAEAHALELAVLEAMHERFPGQLALGLEMLERPFQKEADAFVDGTLAERDFHKVWLRSWGDFVSYREILRFARDHAIPLVALNASAAMRRAVREGTPPGSAGARPEMDLGDRYHRQFIEGFIAGHGPTPGTAAPDPEAFYRVQVLWDEAMAETAAAYLESAAGRGRRLLVIAGGNHVRYGLGVPRRLFRRVPLPYVIVEAYVNDAIVDVPDESRMRVEAPRLPFRPADIYWSVGYRSVRDRQVRLGVRVEPAGAAGVRVTEVTPDGPGRAAGIRAGDVILAVDGIEVNDPSDLVYEVGQHARGQTGTVEVLRGSERLRLTVTFDA